MRGRSASGLRGYVRWVAGLAAAHARGSVGCEFASRELLLVLAAVGHPSNRSGHLGQASQPSSSTSRKGACFCCCCCCCCCFQAGCAVRRTQWRKRAEACAIPTERPPMWPNTQLGLTARRKSGLNPLMLQARMPKNACAASTDAMFQWQRKGDGPVLPSTASARWRAKKPEQLGSRHRTCHRPLMQTKTCTSRCGSAQCMPWDKTRFRQPFT